MNLLRKPFLFFLATVAITAVFAQNTEPEFSLHLELEQDTVKLGSPAKGKIILTNTSNHDEEVYSDASRDAHQSGFTFEFLDPQGRALELTAQAGIMIGASGHVALKPGGTTYYTFNLAYMYHITQPGVYTLQAQILNDPKSMVFVKSDKVTVTVTK